MGEQQSCGKERASYKGGSEECHDALYMTIV